MSTGCRAIMPDLHANVGAYGGAALAGQARGAEAVGASDGAGQPHGHTQHAVADDQPQAPRTHVMRSKLALRITAGARLSVTHTIGTPPAHRAVVFLDFACSGDCRQFDTQG